MQRYRAHMAEALAQAQLVGGFEDAAPLIEHTDATDLLASADNGFVETQGAKGAEAIRGQCYPIGFSSGACSNIST